jgi:SAM-dependent methyltransferase
VKVGAPSSPRPGTYPSAKAGEGYEPSAWYVRAFQKDYLDRYAYRSDELGARETRLIVETLNVPAGGRVLDLCCGGGRHARALARRGIRVVGVDLSAGLLEEAARHSRGLPVEYFCGDMREIPLGSNSVDGVASLFTSFGYFHEDSENQRVFADVHRVLKPGARYVLDFLNAPAAIAGLIPRSVRFLSGGCLKERRWYDGRSGRINKLVLGRYHGNRQHVFETVRAYRPRELEEMLAQAGLHMEKRFGNLTGAEFDPRGSPRCVLVSRKD